MEAEIGATDKKLPSKINESTSIFFGDYRAMGMAQEFPHVQVSLSAGSCERRCDSFNMSPSGDRR